MVCDCRIVFISNLVIFCWLDVVVIFRLELSEYNLILVNFEGKWISIVCGCIFIIFLWVCELVSGLVSKLVS